MKVEKVIVAFVSLCSVSSRTGTKDSFNFPFFCVLLKIQLHLNNLKKTNKNSHTDVENNNAEKKKTRSSLHSGIIFNRSFDKKLREIRNQTQY